MKQLIYDQSLKKKKGFTLIELLVVIAIISILSSILFPVFARARENARRTSCQSNLKQIALSIMQYTQDFDEHFPTYLPYVSAAHRPYGWADQIQAYLKNVQILKCPSARSADSMSDDPSQVGYTHYSYNMRLTSNNAGNASTLFGIHIAALSKPTLTILNIDNRPYNARAYDWGCGVGAACAIYPAGLARLGNGPASAAQPEVTNRHLNGVNIAFTDGHVKWYKSAGADSPLLANVYNSMTPGTTSGNNPTFNPAP